MPGRNNSTNKYGWTAFTVGTVLGDGCNYNTVQSAIDDCFAAGGGMVLIRTGTYNENLILRPGVDLVGADVDGRLPAIFSHVVIQGNHSFSAAAGFNVVICENITFSALAGDALTLTATTGAQIIFAVKFCGLEAFTDPASRAVVLDADAASGVQISTDNSNFNSSSHTFEAIGAGNGSALLSLGAVNSQTGDVFRLSAGSGSLAVEYMNVSSAIYVFNGITAAGNVTFSYSDVSSGLEAVIFPGGGGNCIASHSTISSGAGSGFWIDGAGGQVDFVDIALTGSAQGIGAALIQQKLNWQPYGEAAAAALGSNRGTSSYNSAQFTVTDGWVQLSGSGGMSWVDQPVSTTVVSGEGNFITGAGVILTLPAAPLQGDVCKFKDTTNNTFVIQANAGQSLQVANQTSLVAGTATSTQIGDAMELTYFAAGATWIANSIVGNWNIV